MAKKEETIEEKRYSTKNYIRTGIIMAVCVWGLFFIAIIFGGETEQLDGSNDNNTGNVKTSKSIKTKETTTTTTKSIEQLQQEEKEYKAACKKYNYKDILRHPENFEGKQIYWLAKVNQKINSYTYKMAVNCEKNQFSSGGYLCKDDIYVVYYGDEVLIDDDLVELWGKGYGTETYTSVLGASITIPKFKVEYVHLKS